MWTWLLKLFGVSGGQMIKWLIIIGIILSIVGFGWYKWNSINNAFTEASQKIELLEANNLILAENVNKALAINKKNAKILKMLEENQEFLQELEKASKEKKRLKKLQNDKASKDIEQKKEVLGDKPLTPLLGEALNILEQMDALDEALEKTFPNK